MAVAAPGTKVAHDLEEIALKALRKEPARALCVRGRPVFGCRAFPRGPTRDGAPRRLRVPRPQVRPEALGGLAAAALIAASLVAGLVVANQRAQEGREAIRRRPEAGPTVMFDLHDDIARLPGSTKFRATLVKTGLEYADALARESSSDPDLQREVAAAYSRLAEVQGGANSNLGDREGAKESYLKALAIGEALVASRFATDQDRLLLATNLVRLSRVSGSEARGGLQRAREIQEAALRADPRSFEARQGLAVTHTALAGVSRPGPAEGARGTADRPSSLRGAGAARGLTTPAPREISP